MIRASTLLLCALWLVPSPAVAQSPLEAPFDTRRWATFLVNEVLEVRPHERVLFLADPGYFPDFLDALRAQLMAVPAVEVGLIPFDGPEAAEGRWEHRPRTRDPEYRRRADAAIRRLYEEADVYFWLPFRSGMGEEEVDRRLHERMAEETGTRGVHFHWILGLPLYSPAEISALDTILARALDIDYRALSAHQDRLLAALRGTTLRITDPRGTDLRVNVPEDAWLHKNDGRMDLARAAEARSARDLEMEIPAGALRFIPDPASAEGVLVLPEWGPDSRDVRFEFREGRVVSLSAAEGEDDILEFWDAHTGDKDRIGEIVLGTNPALATENPAGGRPPYAGYGAGVLRIHLGENWESGGTLRSSLEAWLFLTDASLEAGPISILEEGRIVLP